MEFHTADSLADLQADLLVVAVPEGEVASILESVLGEAGAPLAAAAEADEFTGKIGTRAVFPAFGLAAFTRVALVGVGSVPEPDAVRRAAGQAGMVARDKKATSVVIATGVEDPAELVAAVEGFAAGAYRFDRYKAASDRKPEIARVTLVGGRDPASAGLGHAIVAGQTLARDLVNLPAAEIHPASMVEQAQALAGENITVDVWDEGRMKAAGMGGILAVGQGSTRPPRLVHLVYKPAGGTRSGRRVGMVGKGVTFDSGGLSLKPSASMQTMRCDMAGAACVLGVMRAVRALQPDVEVHGIIGLAENMNSGNSYKLGDILSMYNGKTVEVHNTDAEGRLVLADCLTLACEQQLDELVDIATLTGAAVVALGDHFSGLFTRSEDLAQALLGRAQEAGEGLWRLPLPDGYKEQLKAEWGDLKNVGGRAGGAITAALFLSEFVDGPAWAHLDIAGPAFLEKSHRHFVAGGTGAMVPTLTRWVVRS